MSPCRSTPVTVASNCWPMLVQSSIGGGGLLNLPFHFLGGVLLFRAVFRQRGQFVVGIWRGTACHRGFEQPLVITSGKRRFGAVEWE